MKDVPILKIKAFHNGNEVEKYLVRSIDLVRMTDDERNEFLGLLIKELLKAE